MARLKLAVALVRVVAKWPVKRVSDHCRLPGQDRLGGIRRFALVLQQLSLNYDLPALNAKQIAELLPREFEVWKRRANWEPVAGSVLTRGPVPRVRFDSIPVGSQWRCSHLAELWGYGHVQSLRNSMIAPRGQDLLVFFITGGDEPAPESGSAAAERTCRWREKMPARTVRRLTRAAKDEVPACRRAGNRRRE